MLPTEAQTVVDHHYKPSAAELWRPEHASPGPVRLVEGDPEQFEADRAAAKDRCTARIHAFSRERSRIVPLEMWPEWWFSAEEWA